MPSLDTSSLQFGELFGVLTTFETDIKTNTIFNKHEEYIERLSEILYVLLKRKNETVVVLISNFLIKHSFVG
jgi:hypothetical protein